ncbi:MAG: tetratricopeptide repeat protein, partial [Syntrophales bacterium]|nr:tetratricopeptide repeat protein [Syntrophales bacterium]
MGKVNRYLHLVCVSLALMVVLLYAPVKDYDFIGFDDRPYVTENPYVTEGLTYEGVKWAFSTFHEANWHPLTWLSLMVDGGLYGLNAGGYHFTNVLFHLANVLLLFLVFHAMTGALWRSGMVAALFAVHPLHVESVAWVAERKDVLSGFFWMLTLGFYVRYVSLPSWGRYGGVVLCFVLGLLSKPMVVTLPLVLLLLDYWPLGRFGGVVSGGGVSVMRGRWFLLWEKVPLLLLSALASAITIYAQANYRVISSLENLPMMPRLENALRSYFLYVKKMLIPVDLAIFYPYPTVSPLNIWQFIVLAALMVALSVTAVVLLKRYPYIAVGWFWYVGTLVPVIGLIQVGAQAMADRYAYLPMIGIYLVLVWLSAEILRKITQRQAVGVVTGVIILSVLVFMTREQLSYWKNAETLFRRAIEVTGPNYVAENNLGLSLLERGRCAEAEAHFLRAIHIQPDFAAAYHNLGVARHCLGQFDAATHAYRMEIRLNPGRHQAYYRLGLALAAQGKHEDAVRAFRSYTAAVADDPGGFAELGTVLTKMGRYDEARDAYKRAMALNGKHPGIINNYAMLLLRMGDEDGAVEQFQRVLQLQPNYANAHYQLSMLYRRKGNNTAAEQHWAEAIMINPGFK